MPSDLVSLWMIRAGLVANPAITQKGIQSCLVFLNGADLCVNCYKVMLCNSSGEYSKSDISWLLFIGCDNSFIPKSEEIGPHHGKGVLGI